MQIRKLAYQQRVLGLLDKYLKELCKQRNEADKVVKAAAKESDLDPEWSSLNFPRKTWDELKKNGALPSSRVEVPYSDRKDGICRPVPNVVYKVPTAGGKTFLAISSLSKIFDKYLDRSSGFVLWIVPNEAIYTQTKKQLIDRQHPYRQLLDTLSGNAVKLMEKTTPLHANDVESNLCVMLLMLQSSNRENKETLKIFQERGDVHGFTPEEGNQLAHQQAVEAVPNLDICDLVDASYPWQPIKDSLGNALRMIRPVVVMDEGHKAVSNLAFKTLYGFNPIFVLELTATPKDVSATAGKNPRPARYQNLLVEVSGLELDREGMIKMPLNLDSRQSTDWKATLQGSLERLNVLQVQAQAFYANSNRYIRPIMLVQVERTGSDQTDGKHIHANDVKDWLTTSGRLDEAEVAIKTSSQNDLKSPENQDLLSDANRIRVIITKQALQEGWDCPFAYVLCSLASSSNQSAMTQMIGRILRQPQAQKTGIGVLDESYVLTHHTETNKTVVAIKEGLEKVGMDDLVQNVRIQDGQSDNEVGTIKRNTKFANHQIFLPKILWVTKDEQRELDYEQDILYPLDWTGLTTVKFVEQMPQAHEAPERQLHKFWLDKNSQQKHTEQRVGSPQESVGFDFAYSTQLISDIIPNSWLAREVVGKVIEGLQDRGFNHEKLGSLSSFINEELRVWLLKTRDGMAEEHFRNEVHKGRIQFRLLTDGKNSEINWKMPRTSHTNQPHEARALLNSKGEVLQRNLFDPQYEDDMNKGERSVAIYMDGRENINWWHRNISRNHYGLQGWRVGKIYPDFICSVKTSKTGSSKLCILEMKGGHLAGNEDTEYKKTMLRLLTNSFSIERAPCVSEASLLSYDGTSVRCDLVLFSEWEKRLEEILV